MRKMRRCTYCRKKFERTLEECPHCGTAHILYHEGDSRLTWFRAHGYTVQRAPFVRFLARVIDGLLFVLLLELVLGPLLSRFMGGTVALQILIPLGFVFEILLEPFFLTYLGYTPGKRILNIAVRDKVGEKLVFSDALRRSLSVFYWGFGLLLPVVSLFTLYFSYVRVAHDEPARWDEDKDVLVLQKKFNLLLGLLAVAVIAVECLIFFNLSHEIFSFHDSMIRKQAQNKEIGSIFEINLKF